MCLIHRLLLAACAFSHTWYRYLHSVVASDTLSSYKYDQHKPPVTGLQFVALTYNKLSFRTQKTCVPLPVVSILFCVVPHIFLAPFL